MGSAQVRRHTEMLAVLGDAAAEVPPRGTSSHSAHSVLHDLRKPSLVSHRRRLLAGAGALGLLAAASALVAVLVGRAIQASWNVVLDQNVASVRAAADLHLRLFQQKGLVASFLIDGDETRLADLEAGRREATEAIETVAAVALTAREAAIADRIREKYRTYDERRQDVLDRAHSGRMDEARRLYLGAMSNDVSDLGAACEDMLEVNEELMAASREDTARLVGRLEWLVGLGAAGVLIVGTVGGWVVARGIDRQQAGMERMAALGHVTSALAHEVRNPLTAISLRLQSAEAERDVPPAVRQDVQVMRQELARLERLVGNILFHAQPPQPILRRVPVADVVDRTLEVLRPAFEQQGVRVESHCEGGTTSVLADPEQLSQVLLNVQLNALQVMPDGGLLRIEARRVAAPGPGVDNGARLVEIRVRDSGPGIPADLRPRVCEPFFTTRGNGLGLGLSIARQILARHSGQLDFEPNEPTGTTVVIRLPCAHPPGETA